MDVNDRPLADNAPEADACDLCGFCGAVAATGDVNVALGKSRMDGMEGVYREMIVLFHDRLPHDCRDLETCLKDKNLPHLAILAHGLKSSLSSIGAMRLSASAFRLEKAARTDDMHACGIAVPLFIEDLRALHAKLDAVIRAEKDAGKSGDCSKG